MAAEYDVSLSHAWTDGERPQQIAGALMTLSALALLTAENIAATLQS